MPENHVTMPTGAKLDIVVLWAVGVYNPERGYITEDDLGGLILRKIGFDAQDPASPHEDRLIHKSLDRLRAAGVVLWDQCDGFRLAKEAQ